MLGAAALTLSPLAVSPARADQSGEITLGQVRVQAIHSGDDSDATNLNFSFTNSGNGYGGCDYGEEDAIASGVEVALLARVARLTITTAITTITVRPLRAFRLTT